MASTDAKQEMIELQKRRTEVIQNLAALEKQIYNFETTYLEETAEHGNVIKGFNKLLEATVMGVAAAASLNNSAVNRQRRPPKRHFEESDRIFSLSSVTSPVSASVALEIAQGAAGDGKQDANASNGVQKKEPLVNGDKTLTVGRTSTVHVPSLSGQKRRRTNLDD